MTRIAVDSRWFNGALPADFAVRWGDPRSPTPPLFAEETAVIANAVEKRRLEFAKGRECARAALRELGLVDQPLLVGSHGEPLWPPGVVGSITHTDGLCVATSGWQASYRGVGIDAEPAEPLEPGIAKRVATLEEMQSVPAMPLLLAARLVFSAKESFYKCQFCETRAWLAFFDVALEFEPNGGFSVRLLVDVEPFARGDCFQGTWRHGEGFLFTAICMPRAGHRR